MSDDTKTDEVEEKAKMETYGLPDRTVKEILENAKRFKHEPARVVIIMKCEAQRLKAIADSNKK